MRQDLSFHSKENFTTKKKGTKRFDNIPTASEKVVLQRTAEGMLGGQRSAGKRVKPSILSLGSAFARLRSYYATLSWLRLKIAIQESVSFLLALLCFLTTPTQLLHPNTASTPRQTKQLLIVVSHYKDISSALLWRFITQPLFLSAAWFPTQVWQNKAIAI